MAISRRPGYHTAQDATWQPKATYGLLATIVGVFVAQMIVLQTAGPESHRALFVISTLWPTRPWTLVTSTLSHGGLGHLLFNGIVLFFFGPSLERIVGRRAYLILFFVSGAIAGVLQVHLSHLVHGGDPGGLGASGALMMVFGALMILMPRQQILLFAIVPVPFWAAGVGFALLDILRALNPGSGIGNFAHLSGMAIGIALGLRIRQQLKRRGLRITTG